MSRGEIPLRVHGRQNKGASWYFMSKLQQKVRIEASSVSELPERLGAFAALLSPGEADVGQRAIIQGAEVLTRAPALAPNQEGREDRPRPKPPDPHRKGKGNSWERLSVERH